jgi:hypothetical protein
MLSWQRKDAMRLVDQYGHGDDFDSALEAILAINVKLEDAEGDVDDFQSQCRDANWSLEQVETRLAELCDPSHRGMVQKIVTDLFTHGGVACKLFREDGSEVDSYDVERSLKELFTSEGVYDGCP